MFNIRLGKIQNEPNLNLTGFRPENIDLSSIKLYLTKNEPSSLKLGLGQKCLILTNVKNNRERPICILQYPNSNEPNLKIESDRKALYKKKKEKEKNKFSIKICKITSSMFKIKFTFLYKRNKNHRNNKN